MDLPDGFERGDDASLRLFFYLMQMRTEILPLFTG
jgi:hypothetical protein